MNQKDINTKADTEYLIQDTRNFVGNAVLWWRPDGKGYTTNLDEAGRYDERRARSIAINRDTDKPIRVDVALSAASRVVNADALSAAIARSETAAEAKSNEPAGTTPAEAAEALLTTMRLHPHYELRYRSNWAACLKVLDVLSPEAARRLRDGEEPCDVLEALFPDPEEALAPAEAAEIIAGGPEQTPKPFPSPGSVWRFKGNELAPPSGPRTVTGLRWFRGRVEALFGPDSCAGVEHLMGLAEWICERTAPTPLLEARSLLGQLVCATCAGKGQVSERDVWGPENCSGAPWQPKAGDRVRTADRIVWKHAFTTEENQIRRRQFRATGRVLRPETRVGVVAWVVLHDDGTEAPYDVDELLPEPAPDPLAGRTYSRPVADACIPCECNDPPCARHPARLCVAVLATDPQGRVLLVHSNKGRDRAWELPGGKPEPGEDMRDAAIREVREETGLDVELFMCEPTELPATATHRGALLFRGRAEGAAKAGSDAAESYWWTARGVLELHGSAAGSHLSDLATRGALLEWAKKQAGGQ